MIFFPPTQTLSCEEYFSDDIDYSLTVTINSTSENYYPIGKLMIIKKTDYAKKEKKDKQFLTCHCNDCSGDGSGRNGCMSK
jgi:hypothetical protein